MLKTISEKIIRKNSVECKPPSRQHYSESSSNHRHYFRPYYQYASTQVSLNSFVELYLTDWLGYITAKCHFMLYLLMLRILENDPGSICRDKRNTLSKMSFFVPPKSPISSKILSKFLIFVQIKSSN